jgi:Amt family ammonium transporter
MPIDSRATAWVLLLAALVALMTPGPAFFYGGMVRSKNVLGMLMQTVFSMGLVSELWATVGFSLTFVGTGRFVGNFDFAFLRSVVGDVGHAAVVPGYGHTLVVPAMAFVAFQMISPSSRLRSSRAPRATG